MSEEQSTETAPEPDVLEGELPPGVSQENMTREQAQAVFADFLEHVGIPGVKKVFVAEPVVVEGDVYQETPAQKAFDKMQREEARAKGAQDAHLEVGESLDEPITLETSLQVLIAALERTVKAAQVVLRTAKVQQELPLPWDPEDMS